MMIMNKVVALACERSLGFDSSFWLDNTLLVRVLCPSSNIVLMHSSLPEQVKSSLPARLMLVDGPSVSRPAGMSGSDESQTTAALTWKAADLLLPTSGGNALCMCQWNAVGCATLANAQLALALSQSLSLSLSITMSLPAKVLLTRSETIVHFRAKTCLLRRNHTIRQFRLCP